MCWSEARREIESLRSDLAAVQRCADELWRGKGEVAELRGELESVNRGQRTISEDFGVVRRDVLSMSKAISELKEFVRETSALRREIDEIKRYLPLEIALTEGPPFKGVVSHVAEECS